ncbi:unnamed protein product [Allacma fusca]|uniref:Uncharacterized protein n=1 Tax=Allacma fusca TaxID=39272 RepID=A0A8J2PEY1_9HEXA|nr:unnamed protein product [Allacma fusca]
MSQTRDRLSGIISTLPTNNSSTFKSLQDNLWRSEKLFRICGRNNYRKCYCLDFQKTVLSSVCLRSQLYGTKPKPHIQRFLVASQFNW